MAASDAPARDVCKPFKRATSGPHGESPRAKSRSCAMPLSINPDTRPARLPVRVAPELARQRSIDIEREASDVEVEE